VQAFAWPHLAADGAGATPGPWEATPDEGRPAGAEDPVPPGAEDPGLLRGRAPDPASVEREAYARGYAAGEQAGNEAALARLDGLHRRFVQAIEDLGATRDRVLRDAERQVLQVALAIARRVVRRECTTHPEVVAAIAHAAVERLAATDGITLRLHPADATALSTASTAAWPPRGTVVSEDPTVERGGAIVESAGGTIDATLEAQLDEIARVLLGDDDARPIPFATHALDAQRSLRPASRAATDDRGEAA